MMNKFTEKVAWMLVGGLIACAVHAQEGAVAPVEIKREVHLKQPPRAELANKAIFIAFEDSPKMTSLVRQKLRDRGLTLIDDASAADAKFQVWARFRVSGAGKEDVVGKLGELLESNVSLVEPSSPDYTRTGNDLVTLAAGNVLAGILTPSDLFVWLTQKIGLGGRINEAITGDPRGFCLSENCNKFVSAVMIRVVGGDDGFWWLQASAMSDKLVLDQVIADSLETALQPFYDLRPAATQAAGEAGRP